MHFILNSQLTPILYIFQLRQHQARLPCALIITVNILTKIVYRSLYCAPTLIPAVSSLTERTSDNQLCTTFVRNDVAQVVIHQIVTLFVGNKMLYS